MAEEHNEVTEEAKTVKSKSSSLIMIMIVVLVLILVGGGVAGYFIFMAPKSAAPASPAQQMPAAQGDAEMAAGSVAEGFSGPMKSLDSFIVNLTDAQGTRYLKVVMQLEMSNDILGTEIDRKTPQIRDEIIMLLSSKAFDDVSSIAGKRALKRGVLNSVNRYLTTGRVLRVYFSEFVVQ
ncbi:MAG: flagellar basal body-associated FliL family protein [Deltaproteobacteria bacterium]|nr:flagellar basal body-associated FliL family protein [Deltaproteobacteria bacterium]